MGASELGADYKKARARLKREAPPICALCGQDIDLTLDRYDPMSWTADHIVPLAKGGHPGNERDISNLQPAHWKCNCAKQDKFKKLEELTDFNCSRVWLEFVRYN